MTRYVLRRFLMSLLTLLVLICLTFCMMHAIPGGPFTSDKGLSPFDFRLSKKFGNSRF